MDDRSEAPRGNEPDWLSLPFDAFDQTEGGGWRPVAHRGEYDRAAEIIGQYLEHRPDLSEGQRRILHFHAGQMRAFADRYPEAIGHFKNSFEPVERENAVVRWNDYVKATLAFLEGDREGLLRARDAIAGGPKHEGRVPNLHVVDRLLANFGKPYSEAY
jgi:hypothetical protein